MYDICAIGDALIDFIPAPDYTPKEPVYQARPGGTITNLLVAAAKLSLHCMFTGKIGDDCMGRLIRDSMADCGVDLSGCVMDEQYFTTQSFVSLDENGERSFSFSRKFGADVYLHKEELRMEQLIDTRLFAFSGMCLTDEPVRETTLYALDEVYQKDIPIALDVNYRHNLWQSEAEMTAAMHKTLPYVTICKASEEEACLLTGKESLMEAARYISGFGCKYIFITLGEKGAFYYTGESYGLVPSYPVRAVDTTGAGDSFFAALLYGLLNRGLEGVVSEAGLKEILQFANAAGALATTKRGGAAGAPWLSEIQRFMEQENKKQKQEETE